MLPKKFYRAAWKFRNAAASLFASKCTVCGEAASGESALCKSCRRELENPAVFFPKEALPYSEAVSCGVYDGAAKSAMLKYKFSDAYKPLLPDLLRSLIFAYDKYYSGVRFDLIIPVPFYDGGDETESGFRLEELTKAFARCQGISFKPKLLKKTRKTRRQHDLSVNERKINLLGAFSASAEVRGKRILLIDDIFTTGSTVLACSKALREQNAADVRVLTVLKTKFL